jgi:hypothetical protein
MVCRVILTRPLVRPCGAFPEVSSMQVVCVSRVGKVDGQGRVRY